MEYDATLGDHRLSIKPIPADTPNIRDEDRNKLIATMKDEYVQGSTAYIAILTQAECEQLIKEFEDPDGELALEEGSIYSQHFQVFMP